MQAEAAVKQRTSPDRPDTQVGRELQQLAKNTESLLIILSSLEDVLNPVLRTQSENATGGPSAPEPSRVPLADMLHNRAVAIGHAETRVREIIERLEL